MQKTLRAVLALLLWPGIAPTRDQPRTFPIPFHTGSRQCRGAGTQAYFARAQRKDEPFIEQGLKFRQAVLKGFDQLVREGVPVADLPAVQEMELEAVPEPEEMVCA